MGRRGGARTRCAPLARAVAWGCSAVWRGWVLIRSRRLKCSSTVGRRAGSPQAQGLAVRHDHDARLFQFGVQAVLALPALLVAQALGHRGQLRRATVARRAPPAAAALLAVAVALALARLGIQLGNKILLAVLLAAGLGMQRAAAAAAAQAQARAVGSTAAGSSGSARGEAER